MPYVQTDYKSYIIHIAHFKILWFAQTMVTYNNKSIPDNKVNSDYVPTLNPVQILGNVLLANTDFPLQPSGGTSTHFFILLLWSVIDLTLQWLFSAYSKCLPHKNFHLLITFSVVFQFVLGTKKWYHIFPCFCHLILAHYQCSHQSPFFKIKPSAAICWLFL